MIKMTQTISKLIQSLQETNKLLSQYQYEIEKEKMSIKGDFTNKRFLLRLFIQSKKDEINLIEKQLMNIQLNIMESD